MRIIKFRIFDPFQKVFIEPSKYIFNADLSERLFRWNVKLSPDSHSEKCLISQFTGMKDKNGVDIYEGDVLTTPNKGKGIVEWFECGFVLRLQNETVWTNLLLNVVGHYNIEGNIYENTEFLN